MSETEGVLTFVGVDLGRCSGHARCNAVAPEIFGVDDDGFSNIGERRPVGAGMEDLADRGVRACPEHALFVTRGEVGAQ